MQVTASMPYPAEPSAVFAMLADQDFLSRVCTATGAISQDVDVQRTGEGSPDTSTATLTTKRVLPTDEVPDFVRRFVGETLTVTRVDAWGPAAPDGSRSGTITVEIAGAPVRFSGTLSLRPAAGGSVEDVVGDLKASVPFIGGRVEEAAEPAIRAAMSTEERVGREWLSRA